jgi:hypothetical protein
MSSLRAKLPGPIEHVKPSAAPAAAIAFFQIIDVGGDRGLPGVFDRASADRTARTPACGAAHQRTGRFRILIELREFLPVAAVGEGRQRHVGDARLSLLGFRHGIRRDEARHARESVIPPDTVIVVRRHRLAELAIIDDVDAGIALLAHHVSDCTGETLCVSRIVFALAARPRPVHLDEICRPR